jgi:peptide/nickel transport system substrate-binding protein
MTLTINISPDAVWDDGTPITVKDFQCNYNATLNTPGSLSTTGYDKIQAVEQGSDDHEVVVTFTEKYAPYKNLFNGMFEASKVQDCNDVSADFQDSLPFSGREWKLDSWSPDQAILVPNDKFWDSSRTPKAAKVVMVPKADTDTEINSLKSGESDFIFPQAYNGITDALADPNIKYTPGYGTNYEGLYFQQGQDCTPSDTKSCAFKDADFRKAFSESVDRDGILAAIYDPIFPGSQLLQCGLWVPTIGEWCDNTQFQNSYNPTDAETTLTGAGWTKNGDGLWADKTGNVPTIHWMVNAGNARRESTQALLIPKMKEAGFNIVADNCDAACVFQTRLPALDYDLAMYINTAQPDPTVTGIMSCDQVPSAANNNQGQNSTGWCNEDASALMVKSDQELDQTARVDEIHEVGQALVDDNVMLPLFQFPNIAAWRTDKLTGPIDADAANYRAFANNLYQWQPTSGDQIVIGAEQWPDCLNPITDCANSSWYVWTALFPIAPDVWDTTADGDYTPSSLVTGEPTVDTGG